MRRNILWRRRRGAIGSIRSCRGEGFGTWDARVLAGGVHFRIGSALVGRLLNCPYVWRQELVFKDGYALFRESKNPELVVVARMLIIHDVNEAV